MRIWVYVLAAVILIAGVSGLTAEVEVATTVAQILLIALLVSAVSAAIKALLKVRSTRYETETMPDSRSRGQFPEQRA